MASHRSSAAPLASPMGAGTTQCEEDGDEALEAYMSNMMQRVCGDSATG